MKQLDIFNIPSEKPKLFNDKMTPKHYAVIRALEKHCVGYDNKMTANELISVIDEPIKDDFELRLLLKDIKNNESYLRIIGSTSAGTWLALTDDEVNANKYMVNRTKSSLETCLKNGVDINVFFKELNDLKEKYYPVHNQTRHQFNSEKKIIKRYSDDLLHRNVM